MSDYGGSRQSFIDRFGEEQADRLQAAAEFHKNGLHDEPGSDPFRWAVVIALGFECASRDAFRDFHKLTLPWSEFDAWLKESAQRDWLADHDGDADYLSLVAGIYNAYMPERAEAGA